jgi:hypothetical protein
VRRARRVSVRVTPPPSVQARVEAERFGSDGLLGCPTDRPDRERSGLKD